MEFTKEIDGKKMFAKIGGVALQANGSCLVGLGETVVLATATMDSEEAEFDYFPLTIDYEERFYAAGKIKGSRFIKRETRPPDEAILSARAIDRGIRPLFDERLRFPVQIIATVLAVDKENDPDLVALYAASLALSISDIPWQGPISGIRVGRVNNQFVFNPSYKQRETSDLDLLISTRENRILMIEASALQVGKEVFEEATKFGLKYAKEIEDFFIEIIKKVGKEKIKIDFSEKEEMEKIARESIPEIAKKFLSEKSLISKAERQGIIEKIKEESGKELIKNAIGKEKREKILNLTDKIVHQEISNLILEEGKRIDGRNLNEIRQISAEVSVLPRVHGSALFSRGETQVLSVITLGSPEMEQYLDTMEESGRKRFMHHYNFPPFCSGEVGSLRSTGRRETGHGYLVEKGLKAVLPSQEEFPYTIRVVSEVLSSNGSTSMASVCASSLAMMDAGIPTTSPVAGIAIGLASEEGEADGQHETNDFKRYKVFADLQDLEDGEGGMDFKIIASEKGVVAVQMDTKTKGLTLPVIHEAFVLSQEKIKEILEIVNKILAKPRSEMSPYAPRVVTLSINPKKIKDLIGPGGRHIQEIIKQTGAEINVEQDGTVNITSNEPKNLEEAIEMIEALTREIKVGDIFKAKITRLLNFGAFAEIAPGREGLIHVSELSSKFVKNPADLVKIGDQIQVKVIEIDNLGRINLSAKQAQL